MNLTRRALLAALATATASKSIARADAASLRDLLSRRRMVRRFRPDPIGDDVVERLIDAATRAERGNLQPWAFVVVRDERRRRELGRAALGQMWLADAPVSIVACADAPRSRQRYRDRGERYALIDTAFASLLLLLAVGEEGLGACFVGAFDDAEVARLLKLPSDVRPVAVIPVGHPAEKPKRTARRRASPTSYIARPGRSAKQRRGGRRGCVSHIAPHPCAAAPTGVAAVRHVSPSNRRGSVYASPARWYESLAPPLLDERVVLTFLDDGRGTMRVALASAEPLRASGSHVVVDFAVLSANPSRRAVRLAGASIDE